MLLIFLSWIYILFTTINLGFGFDKISKTQNNNFVVTSVFGLCSITILASIWAIFGRINIEFHAFLFLLNLLIFWKFNSELKTIYKYFFSELKKLERGLQAYLLLISILILAQCAAIPYIIDNESYYIQTIKWLNEYGFVKGLANLHIFFGQTSGWHIAQSVFNFSFLYENFNDLNGFCLLLGNIFAVLKLNLFFENQNKTYLTIGLLPFANALLFQFISAPSPDLPVYILSFIAFFYFLESNKNIASKNFNRILIVSLFILYIKPTAIALLILPIVFLFQNFKKVKTKLVIAFNVGLVFLGLFIFKNTIITGYPFYPTQLFCSNNFDFGVPKKMVSFFFDETKLYAFLLTKAEFQSMTFFQIFIKWLTINRINAVFNSLSVLLVVFCPIFIFKYNNKKSVWILYGIMTVQLIILLLTSPQFRFFIHFILFFSFFILACIVENKKKIIALLYASSILIMIFLFMPMQFSMLTKNKLILENSRFLSHEAIFPHSNSKLNPQFHKIKIGNLEYNSPDKNTYFWITGNGNLPCVNSQQLDFFQKKFHYIPQMRTNNLKDGFYSKKKSDE